MLFQKNVVKKYLASLPEDQVQKAWKQYRNYFFNASIQQNILQSKEEQFQEGFLRELFVKVLGYTLNPSPNFNLITEQKNETNSKKADGAILLEGKVVGIIELKDHKTPDLSKVEAQAFGYKNQHPDARLVIISNFEKLRLYIDNTVEHREWNLFTITEQDFRELYLCLAFEQVRQEIALKIKQESISNEEQITKALYKDYSQFKRVLFADILAHNPTPDGKEERDWTLLLFKKTQKLLDRLLFIFFAEDCGLLPPNSMVQIIEQWEMLKDVDAYVPFYERVKKYFGYMNTGFQGKKYEIFAYNGGLFKPDEVLDSITISDEVLVEHTKRLSAYDFESEVDVNILGHIFENSLSEIEEVTQSIARGLAPLDNSEAIGSTVSKRKQDGVFYTPQYITKYIVENTVGRLCTEKKQELGIVEEEYFADKNRQLQTRRRMDSQLMQYREWLMGITILDPACGSGAFLNAAFKFLKGEHEKVFEMMKKITGYELPLDQIDNEILEHNLYGVDINEESVEIAQLALWLRTAKPRRKLNTLNQNIKCGNSLISDPAIAGDKAFNWQAEFPQVFAKGGFDVVIGNPPYVDSETMTKSIPEQREYISNQYKYAKGNWDLLIAFIERGFGLLTDNGCMSYITSNKWLALDYGTAIRNFAIPHLNYLIDCTSEKVFDSANISSVVFGLEKRMTNEIKIGHVSNAEVSETNIYKKDRIQSLITENLSIAFSKGIGIISKLVQQATLESFDCSVFGAFTTAEAYLLKPFVKEHQIPSDSEFKLINTGTIDKYTPLWGYSKMKYWEQFLYPIVNREDFKNNFPKRYDKLSKPKIIITGIRYFEAILDYDNSYLPAKSTVAITGDIDKLYYLIVILNSKVISYYIRENYYASSMGGGINFTPDLVRTLPIPDIPKDIQQFREWSDTMLSLNKELQEKRSRFLRSLTRNIEGVKITTALQTFDQMDFKGFLAELKKQKIKLSLAQQDEWEPHFNDYTQACQALSQQISETDKEIDTRVFDLYGLTPEEREVVMKG